MPEVPPIHINGAYACGSSILLGMTHLPLHCGRSQITVHRWHVIHVKPTPACVASTAAQFALDRPASLTACAQCRACARRIFGQRPASVNIGWRCCCLCHGFNDCHRLSSRQAPSIESDFSDPLPAAPVQRAYSTTQQGHGGVEWGWVQLCCPGVSTIVLRPLTGFTRGPVRRCTLV